MRVPVDGRSTRRMSRVQIPSAPPFHSPVCEYQVNMTRVQKGSDSLASLFHLPNPEYDRVSG